MLSLRLVDFDPEQTFDAFGIEPLFLTAERKITEDCLICTDGHPPISSNANSSTDPNSVRLDADL